MTTKFLTTAVLSLFLLGGAGLAEAGQRHGGGGGSTGGGRAVPRSGRPRRPSAPKSRGRAPVVSALLPGTTGRDSAATTAVSLGFYSGYPYGYAYGGYGYGYATGYGTAIYRTGGYGLDRLREQFAYGGVRITDAPREAAVYADGYYVGIVDDFDGSSSVNDQEFVALDDLAAMFQLTVREEALGAITVSYKGKTIVLTPDQALASVAGRLISLPAPPVAQPARRWLVPVEFISRALALVYDAQLDLRKPSHLLIVGDLRVPRVTIRYEALGTAARLTIDATPRAAQRGDAGQRPADDQVRRRRARRRAAADSGARVDSGGARGRPRLDRGGSRPPLRRVPRDGAAARHGVAPDDRHRGGADRRRATAAGPRRRARRR